MTFGRWSMMIIATTVGGIMRGRKVALLPVPRAPRKVTDEVLSVKGRK